LSYRGIETTRSEKMIKMLYTRKH